MFSAVSFAQNSINQAEKELHSLAKEVLFHGELDYKINKNKAFTKLLFNTLQRKESFTYRFDSLKTISILEAEDKAFRIFTWHIVDRNPEERRGGEFHYYFGLVQRPFTHPDGRFEMIVTPLISDQRVRGGVENEVLNDGNWLGVQYYLPKYQKAIEKISFKSGKAKATTQKDRQKLLSKINEGRVSPMTGSGRRTDSVYVLGEGMKKTGGQSRIKDFYVLYGWNGADEKINYKVIDILSFDEKDPYTVLFGAGIFYFDPSTPKMRAVFKYSQNAPFSLNRAFVKTAGLFGNKKEVIIYDHLGMPSSIKADPQKMWELGPDGSYDALAYFKNLGFRWIKNVEPVEPPSRVLLEETASNQANIMRARLMEIKRLASLNSDQETVNEVNKMLKKDDFNRQALRFIKQQEKALAARLNETRKEEEARLKQAGINLNNKGKSRGNRR
mgnify:CR=1 FL=1